MIILCLPIHSALGQDVGQLGVVGEVRAARVGELSVIFTEKTKRNGYNQRLPHSLIGCGPLQRVVPVAPGYDIARSPGVSHRVRGAGLILSLVKIEIGEKNI